MNKEMNRLMLVEYVGKLLISLERHQWFDINGSVEHNYLAKDVVDCIRPLLNSQEFLYDVYYNADDDLTAVLRMY